MSRRLRPEEIGEIVLLCMGSEVMWTPDVQYQNGRVTVSILLSPASHEELRRGGRRATLTLFTLRADDTAVSIPTMLAMDAAHKLNRGDTSPLYENFFEKISIGKEETR